MLAPVNALICSALFQVHPVQFISHNIFFYQLLVAVSGTIMKIIIHSFSSLLAL